MIPERMAFIMLLVIGFCLLAGPGMARDISSGDTIFDYEVVTLNASLGTPGPYSFLARYTDDDVARGTIFIIPVEDGNGSKTLDLTRIDLEGNYGTYFPVYAGGADPSTRIYIREPRITLDAVLNASRSDSIVGKTIPKKTAIAFKIESPEVGTFLKDQASVRVEVTVPSGAKIIRIGSVDLSNVLINGSMMYLPVPAEDLRTLDDGTYTVRAAWKSPQGFADNARHSNVVYFTLVSTNLRLDTNTESVVRGNSFTLTIRGDSKQDYYLYVKNSSTQVDAYPFIRPDQPGVTLLDDTGFSGAADANADTLANGERAKVGGAYVAGTAAVVRTQADGNRTVEFGTSTPDRTFTFKVRDPTESSRYDEVKVKIEKGSVTITADYTGIYFIGEEVTLSGTSTAGEKVYLFMNGPSLGDGSGVNLTDISKWSSAGISGFVEVPVESDDTWEYTWDTGDIKGGVLGDSIYTIYAVALPRAKDNLSDTAYATFSVNLRKPGFWGSISSASIRQGDDLYIRGSATGSQSGIQIWIFGENYRAIGKLIPVTSRYAQWSYPLHSDDTFNLSGEYYVIVQHPMIDRIFGVRPLHPENISDCRVIDANGTITDLSMFSSLDAARFVSNAITSPPSDDSLIQLSFRVEEVRYIDFDLNSLQSQGWINDGKILLWGSSNYPEGTPLSWAVTPYNGTTVLESGVYTMFLSSHPSRSWNFEVNLSKLDGGNYTAVISSPDKSVQDSLNFTLYGGSEPIYPESADYGVKYAFVYPSIAEPFKDRYFSKIFTTLISIVPKNKDGLPFPSANALQIEARGDYLMSVRYSIDADGNYPPFKDESPTVKINGWDLAYPAGVDAIVSANIRCGVQNPLSKPYLPDEGGVKSFTFLKIVQMDQGGTPISGSAFMINQSVLSDETPAAPPALNTIALSKGWNFVSVPKTLAAGNNTAAIFSAVHAVNASGHSALRYDTAAGRWVALKATDAIAPLEGIWIYAVEPATVPLHFSTDLPAPPAERALSKGWNAVGITAAVPAPATETAVICGGGGGGSSGPCVGGPASARDTLLSLGEKWTTLIGFDPARQTFETAVVNGGSGAYADSRLVYPCRGYWLYMTEPGTLCALTV